MEVMPWSRSAVRLVAALACTLVVTLGAAGTAGGAGIAPYRGLGAWVDIYDEGILKDPEAAVAGIDARGVRTVYLETANYRQSTAIVRPKLVSRFLEAAHAAGLRVVAWYLPGFLRPAVDIRRSLAAIRFESAGGQRFDGFALDIEDPAVKPARERTARLLRVAREIREQVGPRYALGAIIPSPRGMELLPTYWPRFPYVGLAKTFDVFLPMVYFTYRTDGRVDTRAYVGESIAVLRRETGKPRVRIHLIGGVADSASKPQLRGFVDAACADSLFGASLYDLATTAPHHWPQLDRLATCVTP